MPWQAAWNPRPGGRSLYERVLAATRALDWPARSLDVEAQASRVVGDEFVRDAQLRGDRAGPGPVAGLAS